MNQLEWLVFQVIMLYLLTNGIINVHDIYSVALEDLTCLFDQIQKDSQI